MVQFSIHVTKKEEEKREANYDIINLMGKRSNGLSNLVQIKSTNTAEET